MKPTNQQNKYKIVDGHKVLEFLACRDLVYGEWKLPGVFNLFLIYIISLLVFQLVKSLMNFKEKIKKKKLYII